MNTNTESLKAPEERQPPPPENLVLTTGPMFLPSEREKRVAEAAYFRFIRRGCEPGDPVQDWLEAEAEIGGRTPSA